MDKLNNAENAKLADLARQDLHGKDVRPDWTSGLPYCEERCPSYDGKRCQIIGHRPDTFCEPAIGWMAGRLVRAPEVAPNMGEPAVIERVHAEPLRTLINQWKESERYWLSRLNNEPGATPETRQGWSEAARMLRLCAAELFALVPR